MSKVSKQFGLCFLVSDAMIESMGEQKAWEYAKMEINYQYKDLIIKILTS